MPWKTEIDRMVNRAVVEGLRGGDKEHERVQRLLTDLIELAPDRAETHFHLGTVSEVEPELAESFDDSEGAGARWRFLGRLEAASRRGKSERVQELVEDDHFEDCLENAEGRIALRAVGRAMLRAGEDQRIFDWYTRHLGAVDDPASRRDADFLLEEALRRADRYERGERRVEEARERLGRAAQFVEAAGLEPRSGAKVDRKLGRLFQLEESWDDARECYKRALERLPEEDPYRSVLVGDLALAVLGVRGTLDLMPEEERENRDEAIALLEQLGEGEGRSYNAIYTLGVLRYEQGEHETAQESFREADRLMRENRAKARIVHARARFFGSHCALTLGAEGEELDAAAKSLRKDSGPANLDDELKTAAFDTLRALTGGDTSGGRGRRRGRGNSKKAEELLVKAREVLDDDPHQALQFIDDAFRSEPDFDTWFGAYTTRIESLVALEENEEAVRTYERFRGKLYQRETFDRIETLLTEDASPVKALLDDQTRASELVDLYEVMPERDAQFVENCVTCAEAHLASGEAAGVARAVNMLREASARDADAVKSMLEKAESSAAEAGVATASPNEEDGRALVEDLGEAPFILLVGGDDGRQPHRAAFKGLAQRVGFDGNWIPTGSQPPSKTMRAIKHDAKSADAILLHHDTHPEVKAEVERLASKWDIHLRQSPWLGVTAVPGEVLRTLEEAFPIEEEEAAEAE